MPNAMRRGGRSRRIGTCERTRTKSGIEGVSVADISGVVAGHEYCTKEPWTYGITVLYYNDQSLAPFHPTPQGQAAIAAILKESFPGR